MRIPVVDVNTLARNWWAVLLRGVAAILFGLITFVAPGISLAALVLLFGAYAFVDGVLAIASALGRRGAEERWWVLLLQGIVSIIAALVTVFWPGVTALALLFVIAAWAILTGVLQVVVAIRLRKAITGEWLLALGGIASIVFGVLVLLFPGAGALAVVLWIGAYALVFGSLLTALALRLRSLGRSGSPRAAAGAA